jgi:hypothetical protein
MPETYKGKQALQDLVDRGEITPNVTFITISESERSKSYCITDNKMLRISKAQENGRAVFPISEVISETTEFQVYYPTSILNGKRE